MKDPRLLIPAWPVLLEGWCGPVIWDTEPATLTVDGWVGAPDGEGHPAECFRVEEFPLLALDLARDEVADRVARVLAAKAKGPMGHTSGPSEGVQWCRWWDGVWMLRGDGDLVFTTTNTDFNGTDIVVEGLDVLDPKDDTRLPSGARLVDRIALGIVARHVLADSTE